MSSAAKKEILNCFKRLHLARKSVFMGDKRALEAARLKINEEFKRNKFVEDPKETEKLVKLAKDIEYELRTNLIQAVETKPGHYTLNIKEETQKLDNVLFDPNANIPPPRSRKCKDK